MSKYVKGIVFALIPAGLFYLMEAYEHNPFVEVRGMAQFFNILIFEMIAWLLFFLIGKAKWAIRIEAVLAMVFGLTNHYVMVFRSTPFVPWDLFSVKTAASVANNYDFTPSARVVIVTLAFILLMTLVQWFEFKLKSKLMVRAIPAVLIVVCLSIFVNLLWDEDFQTNNNLYPFLFTPAYMTQVNGMAVTFAMDLAYMTVDKPSGYSADEAQEILADYENSGTEDSGAEASGNGASQSEELPNIIVIMDEAFSDLGVLGTLTTNEDYMPFVHSMLEGAENTVSGTLNMSVCGGNTANSEYEFLTGNTMAFLPVGSIPYQQYIKGNRESIASHLKSLGYETYAQHPYYATGWCRNTVYPELGFDNLSFIEDYSPRIITRKYVSDETDFNKIISTFENKPEGKPAFIFNVTMQNHGGYTETFPDFSNSISTFGIKSDALDQYLSLIKMTDTELEGLINYFKEKDEKTIIVFFGDHQPSDYIASQVFSANGKNYRNLSDEDRNKRYQVPFLIWANYDIEEETGANMSANYLGAYALKKAGVETSAYQNYLLDLMGDLPVISAVNTQWKDEAKEDELLTYKKLAYYQLFDRESK